MSVTEEVAALAIAKATGCGLGDKDAAGNYCTILCDDESLVGREKNWTCECRLGARAVLALVQREP
jgi:hypothetical protein